MALLSKTERIIFKETNKKILEQIMGESKNGGRLNVKEMMTEWDFPRSSTIRMNGLFEYARIKLSKEGYIFCCIDKTNWKWGIMQEEEDFQTVLGNRYLELKSRMKNISKIQNAAVQLGYTVESLPRLTRDIK